MTFGPPPKEKRSWRLKVKDQISRNKRSFHELEKGLEKISASVGHIKTISEDQNTSFAKISSSVEEIITKYFSELKLKLQNSGDPARENLLNDLSHKLLLSILEFFTTHEVSFQNKSPERIHQPVRTLQT